MESESEIRMADWGGCFGGHLPRAAGFWKINNPIYKAHPDLANAAWKCPDELDTNSGILRIIHTVDRVIHKVIVGAETKSQTPPPPHMGFPHIHNAT